MRTDAAYFGLSKTRAPSSDFEFERRFKLHVVSPSFGLTGTMPDARKLQAGARIATLVVVNKSASNSLTINDNAGGSLGTITAQSVVLFYLQDNTTQAGIWVTSQTFTLNSGAQLEGAEFEFNLIVAQDAVDYNIRDEVDALGYNGTAHVKINLLIEAGVRIGASGPTKIAIDTGTFTVAPIIEIRNRGKVQGAGGAGGLGGEYVGPSSCNTATVGQAGGTAFKAQVACTFDNAEGEVAGGGGGGGGGGSVEDGGTSGHGGGGGGGAGRQGGSRGFTFGSAENDYVEAMPGSVSGGGAGGTGGKLSGGGSTTTGGAGGALGTAGSSGGNASAGSCATGAAGGAAGKAFEGSSLINGGAGIDSGVVIGGSS